MSCQTRSQKIICFLEHFTKQFWDDMLKTNVFFLENPGETLRLWDCGPPEHHLQNVCHFGGAVWASVPGRCPIVPLNETPPCGIPHAPLHQPLMLFSSFFSSWLAVTHHKEHPAVLARERERDRALSLRLPQQRPSQNLCVHTLHSTASKFPAEVFFVQIGRSSSFLSSSFTRRGLVL